MTRQNQIINTLYAIARKKTALDPEDVAIIKLAAQMLELALKKIRDQRCQLDELEERIAIMLEGHGLLEDTGEGEEGYWDEDNCE